ncbi:hypothetical protein ACFWPQ_06285 [Streptomyces sp. NPDC058464]|uniref:hypothetical protein n=1 Tax=Streptomyces sp. NPDC058464 TaxID=3346511 RepID=UPI0036509CB0
MKLGKALATGVAEERPLVHDEVPELPELPELSEKIREIHEPRVASESVSASEEAPAAR